jgi:hypothetical protein
MSKKRLARIVELLTTHGLMTIATVRPDGWPQATQVAYANVGLRLYFMVGRGSQKLENLRRDPRCSIAIGQPPARLSETAGLSMAALVSEVPDAEERRAAFAALSERHPEFGRGLSFAATEEAADLLRATPTVVSLIDYAGHFGGADLVEVTPDDLRAAAPAGTA